MNDPIESALEFLDNRGISYDVVEVCKQAPARPVNQEDGFATPDKAIAVDVKDFDTQGRTVLLNG
ncbi:hypothetical protein [Haloterrigena alkaliphila]|uniref:Uncharacterized protein n=1 Tax=Haloterrigena alkaliphila TaxID=2816475 RepID=A0A8A2VIZ5_9EURY|nr:hypothetical protein [Haloterrigena alkaliphila]QSW98178.1 hypothetical protein J0X25_12255 [Haloterrigena alkaliphila]